MNAFPYPPGRYFPNSVAGDPKRIIAGDSEILEWCEAHDIDPNQVYALTTISWSTGSRPWLIIAWRWATPKRVARWRRWLPISLQAPKRAWPVVVKDRP